MNIALLFIRLPHYVIDKLQVKDTLNKLPFNKTEHTDTEWHNCHQTWHTHDIHTLTKHQTQQFIILLVPTPKSLNCH